MGQHVDLAGATGAVYGYEAVPAAAPWNDVAGNYAFAERTDSGRWRVLYVGQAASLRDCLDRHRLWAEAQTYGCTHVLAHANPDGVQARWLEERDLVAGLEPPMNTLHPPAWASRPA